MIHIGINGFGRIGKTIFLQLLNDPNVKVCAINATELENKFIEQYLKYDSVHKYNNNFNVEIHKDDYFSCGSQTNIKILRNREAKNLKWRDYGCKYLIDCTGSFLTQDKCKEHDVEYVIMSAPSKDNSPTFVFGVNHLDYNGQQIVSGASCTTNCITPVLKWFNDKLKINNGSFTTIHSTTASQYTVDVLKKNSRTNRSILNSIIPHTTGASSAITAIIPELKDKIQGTSLRVPVSNVSLVDLVIECENTQYSLENLFKEIDNLSEEEKNVISITKHTLVSCDFITTCCPSIIDTKASIDLSNGKYKLMIWYDNEWSYSAQLLRLLKYMDKFNQKPHKTSNLLELDEIDFTNKNVLVRLDFNVPMENNIILDDFRIVSALPTIKYILKHNINRLILTSHFGRPKNNEPEYSLIKIHKFLEQILNISIKFLSNGLTDKTLEEINKENNLVYLLENVRFNKAETNFENLSVDQHINLPEYNIFNNLFDIYINDAFGCSHRKHLSICGIKSNKIRAYGYLVKKEIDNLDLIIKNNTENRKILAIIGGGKIDDKIPMLKSLSKKVSTIFICGGNSNSIIKGEFVDVFKNIVSNSCSVFIAKDGFGLKDNSKLYLNYENTIYNNKDYYVNMCDIGPNSLNKLFELVNSHDIIFWNGTLGIVENNNFSTGTSLLTNYLISINNKKIIVGGGDTACFVNKYSHNFTHVSTGGGASIEYISNNGLIGIF